MENIEPSLTNPEDTNTQSVEQDFNLKPEQENKLKQKIADAKTKIASHLQNSTGLLNKVVPDIDSDQEVNLDELNPLLAQLADQDASGDENYLDKSAKALTLTKKAIEQTAKEQAELEQKTHKPYFKKRDLETRQKELDGKKGLQKLATVFEKSRNDRQITQTTELLNEVNSEIQKKRDLIDSLAEQQKKISKKHEETILSEVAKDITGIKNEYENLYESVVTDGTTVEEVRTLYIEKTIAPIVDKIAAEHNIPESRKDELYTAINESIAHRDETEEVKAIYRQKLDSLLTYDNGFYDAGDRIRSLVNGSDKKIIQRLIVQMAKEDLKKIKDQVKPRLTTYDSQYQFTSIFEKAIDSNERWFRQENSFSGQLLHEFNQYAEYSYPNIEMWIALKESVNARELFGNEITKQDDQIYTTALTNSLSDVDGQHIDMLYYYPTPDAIRNLIVIAAADNVGYRMVHANVTLTSLAKLSTWSQILDEAQEKYEGIKQTRTDLEHWRHTDYYTHQTIRQNSSDLAKALFDQEGSIDPRLTELSARALTNISIDSILEKRGVISEADSKLIKEAHVLLIGMSKESWARRLEDNFNGRYVDSYQYEKHMREFLFNLLNSKSETPSEGHKELIKRFAELSKSIIDQKNDDAAIDYLSDGQLITRLQDLSLSSENITLMLGAYQEIPELTGSDALLGKFCEQFTGQETIDFYKKAISAYSGHEKQLVNILSLLGESKINQEMVLGLPTNGKDILESDNFSVALEFPNLYLESEKDNEFFRKISKAYSNDVLLMSDASRSINNSHLTRELALLFPDQAPTFMATTMRETRFFIFDRADVLLKDVSDIRFINGLVGEFGRKSDQLIRGYYECLKADALTTSDKELVLEFVRQFRVISPTTLKGYKEAKIGGFEKIYMARLQSLAEKMTGGGVITEDERNQTYYKDLLTHVYSNNSGQWSSFESNESCSDRTDDLSEFKIRPVYQIDLLTQSQIKIKEGETLDQVVKASVQQPILDVAEVANSLGNDNEKINADMEQKVDQMILEITQKGGLNGIDMSMVTTIEEKMFLVLADSIYGTQTISPDLLKNIVITYDFTNFENVNDYINGTTDRVGRANNQDYALLCEVNAFYSDRVKDVNKKVVTDALKNPAIQHLLPIYFQRLSQDRVTSTRRDTINRLQIDKLGLTDSFVKQMGTILEKRNGRAYSPEEVKNIIRRYERMTNGLTQRSSASTRQETKAFYGQIRSQREKIFNAFGVITGKEIDPKETYLGEIDLHQVLESEANIREGKYDEDQFATYTAQRFIDIFENERSKIQIELDKFESISGKQREVLNGYISKTKESAQARMVGGVCVSGDNPKKNPEKNLWDMKNYLQMVFQEPDTLQCQGVVLMHHFNENGKKVLTASINPSSTYLYSVDEAALFDGIADSLEVFAEENGFDMLTISRHKNIRTNRTGGEFERAMDRRISKVGKRFTFESEQQFSHSPDYRIKEMDVIWEKKTV